MNFCIVPLYRDIKRHIRRMRKTMWNSLLESSNRVTNSKRYWLLLRTQARRQEVEPSSKHLNWLWRKKKHSSPKAIARVFYRQFTASFVHQDRAIFRRLLQEGHNHLLVDHHYCPFDERGVAVAVKKVVSSTAQWPDGLTVYVTPTPSWITQLILPARSSSTPQLHWSWYSFNLEELCHNTELKAGKPREHGCTNAQSCCSSHQRRYSAGCSSRPSWRPWKLAPFRTTQNRDIPPPRAFSPPLLGCSLVAMNASPLAKRSL